MNLKHRFPSAVRALLESELKTLQLIMSAGEVASTVMQPASLFASILSQFSLITKETSPVSLHRVRKQCACGSGCYRLNGKAAWALPSSPALPGALTSAGLPAPAPNPHSGKMQRRAHLAGFISAFQRPGVTEGERKGSGFG